MSATTTTFSCRDLYQLTLKAYAGSHSHNVTVTKEVMQKLLCVGDLVSVTTDDAMDEQGVMHHHELVVKRVHIEHPTTHLIGVKYWFSSCDGGKTCPEHNYHPIQQFPYSRALCGHAFVLQWLTVP